MDEFTEQFSNCGFKKEMFMPCYGLAENTLMVSGDQGVLVRYYDKEAAISINGDDQEQLAIVAEISNDCSKDEFNTVISAIRECILQDHSLFVYQIALIQQRSLPKTTSGKIRRNVIKELLIDNELEHIIDS